MSKPRYDLFSGRLQNTGGQLHLDGTCVYQESNVKTITSECHRLPDLSSVAQPDNTCPVTECTAARAIAQHFRSALIERSGRKARVEET